MLYQKIKNFSSTPIVLLFLDTNTKSATNEDLGIYVWMMSFGDVPIFVSSILPPGSLATLTLLAASGQSRCPLSLLR